MNMKENRLRSLLNENTTSMSTRMWTTSVFFVEALASTGNFDYTEFVAEYAPFTQFDLQNFCIAAELHNMGSMIKIDFQNNAYMAQKAIASGFQAINFTDCQDAEQVTKAIKDTMPETPECGGRFGYPNNRFIGYQPNISQMEHAKRQKEIVRCFMIEKDIAVKNIEEICSVPGVDMIQFGPSDYCMSKGWDTKDHIDEFKAIERYIIDVALKHGVQPRCEIPNVEASKYYINLGVKQFSLSDQLAILSKFWDEEGGKLKNVISQL
ncbi:MAG: 2,4-dihydroxyhept-2-ene-1,7-dioic acid aldolase [Sphaerochaeta sp.]|nr:2,4-dihydroxyhept-2-ene-1,7-dioic acid aldolase [Sphaerochaeta sp.]